MRDAKGAALLVEKDGKILFVREDETCVELGKYAGMFSIPMGHIKPHEIPIETALREFNEETGLIGEIDYFLGLFQLQMATCGHAYLWAYKGHLPSDDNKTVLPSVNWLAIKDFFASDRALFRPLTYEIIQTFIKSKSALFIPPTHYPLCSLNQMTPTPNS